MRQSISVLATRRRNTHHWKQTANSCFVACSAQAYKPIHSSTYPYLCLQLPMEVVLVAIAVAFCIGIICGALFAYLMVKCCRSSAPVAVTVDKDFNRFTDKDYDQFIAANANKGFDRFLTTGYKENWIYIVSDERRVYHVKPDCWTTLRTNPTSFKWYRLCKICAFADFAATSQASKKHE